MHIVYSLLDILLTANEEEMKNFSHFSSKFFFPFNGRPSRSAKRIFSLLLLQTKEMTPDHAYSASSIEHYPLINWKWIFYRFLSFPYSLYYRLSGRRFAFKWDQTIHEECHFHVRCRICSVLWEFSNEKLNANMKKERKKMI